MPARSRRTRPRRWSNSSPRRPPNRSSGSMAWSPADRPSRSGLVRSKLLRHLFVLALVGCGPAWGQASTPAGLWQTVSDKTGQPAGLVRVVEVDGEYIGTVVAVFSPPRPGPHPLCNLCEGELKDKPVAGMTILRGVRRSGDGYSTGRILDPDEGQVY